MILYRAAENANHKMSFKPPAVRPRFASDLTVVHEIQGRPNTTAPPPIMYSMTAPISIPQHEPEPEDDEPTLSDIMYEKPSKKVVRDYFRRRVQELEEQNEEF